MAFQPQEEQRDPYSTDEYNEVETSQYSQKFTQHLAGPPTFSPITVHAFTQPASIPSSSNNELFHGIEDLCGSEESLSIPADFDDTLLEMLDNGQVLIGDSSSSTFDDWLAEESDKLDLERIDQSIEDRIMSVETQPPTDIRRRYQSDGKRQIEKSRSKPMAIKLPKLTNCQLNSDQSFWIQLILITSNTNPMNKAYIHIDRIEYHADGSSECDRGFVRIPLTTMDIQQGTKQLARISIIKTKLDAYKFELLSFNPMSTHISTDIYESLEAKSVVAKAKSLRDAYHLQSSRIACQLLIKQNTTWCKTNIVCETDIMEENTQNNSKKSSKRSVSVMESDNDEYQVHYRRSAKKQKPSSSIVNGLPVVRVQNSSTH